MPDAKNKATDLIIGRGLITAEAVASELRERLTREIGNSWRYLPQPQLLRLARDILREFEPILAENIARTELASWVAGFDDVAKKLPDDILKLFARLMGSPPKPPDKLILPAFGGEDGEPIIRFPMIEKAAERLMNKNVMRREDFDRASQAVKGESFTIAGDMSEDAVATIRDALADTINEGASLDSFRENLGERLEKSFLGPGHLETTYRTSVQTAFHDGYDELSRDPIVADVFPYRAYLAIHDRRARPTHLALETLGIDGTNVYRKDDLAFWRLFLPSWEWNCRCTVNDMTIEAAARAGVGEAQQWLRTGVKPPLQSRLPFIPFRPPAGFGARRVAA